MHSRRTFEREGFWGIAKDYPIGITTMAMEKVVRDPLQPSPDGGLICMGEVPSPSKRLTVGGVDQHPSLKNRDPRP